jgi:hypothetical protein
MSHATDSAPKTIWTPFNVVAGIIILIGLVLTVLRFTKGLGAVTNLSTTTPGASGSASTCCAVWPWPPGVTSRPQPATFSA